MRVIVLGGYGNFGARICRALATHQEYEVSAAGRDPEAGVRRARLDPRIKSARLDRDAPDFPAVLEHLAPDLVIHCAGPFQGQDYRVVEACIRCGVHYIDLSDSRVFVSQFAERFDASARAADVLVITGASSVPALSSAVADALSTRLAEVHEIRVAIAPGQRAPRGAATIAGVFSYAGKPFTWWRGGRWVETHGWQDLARLRFAGLGWRLGAACDVPDLELFPSRYRGVHTVEFRAALELAIEQHALWFAASVRRAGLPLPIERWASALDRVARLMNPLGSDRGAMLVSLVGMDAKGLRSSVEWHLTANGNHGPEIPCMAAILLTRKLAQGRLPMRGAFPCMGFLSLDEFAPEFARWGMSAVVEAHPRE